MKTLPTCSVAEDFRVGTMSAGHLVSPVSRPTLPHACVQSAWLPHSLSPSKPWLVCVTGFLSPRAQKKGGYLLLGTGQE